MAGKNQILNRLTKTPFPENIRPMLATLYDKPFNSKEWIFEIKWDGYRVISKKRKNTTSLNSRNLNSFDNLFPGITRSLKKIKGDFVIDGEAVAIDESNRPSFQQIQNHRKTGQGSIVYYVFDL
ncbi:MAG TPA: DNA ligase, partial [Bacteroidetes bacterium]|nr:DNA ligase [Bacteroidota bacterium]